MYKIIIPAIAAILILGVGLAQDVYAPKGPSSSEIKKFTSQTIKFSKVLEKIADRFDAPPPEGCSTSENRDGSITVQCRDGTVVVIDAEKVREIRDSISRIGELLGEFQETTDKNGEFWFENLPPG